MAKNSNGVLIIPSLNPNEKLTATVSKACEYFDDVILVNDGSAKSTVRFFDEIKERYGDKIHLLVHEKNMGKGCALKTAFKYYSDSPLKDEYLGVITADSDGQHSIEDIIKLDKGLKEHPTQAFHIGQRNIDDPIVPRRSRMGNKTTAALYRVLYGVKISDTQTGLRAFSNDLVPWLLTIKGAKFEYEMNVLIKCRDVNLKIYEYPIATNYERNHESTFRSVRDSVRVMGVLLGGIIKYVFAALAAAVADIGLFYLLRFVLLPSSMSNATALLISTVVSRACSSVINFIVNRFVTFGGKKISRSSIFKYYLLWLLQMGASYGIVLGFTALLGEGSMVTTVIKIVTDLCLALLSYQIQMRWVFKKKEAKIADGD